MLSFSQHYPDTAFEPLRKLENVFCPGRRGEQIEHWIEELQDM